MLPKLQRSVSPRCVWFAAGAASFLTWSLLVFLLNPEMRKPDGHLVSVEWEIPLLLAIWPFRFLIRLVLSFLGISVRSRSVERFESARRGDKTVAEDIPIQIRCDRRVTLIGGIVLFLAGLGIASIPLVISLTAWRTTAVLLVGEVIMMMGLLVTAYRRAKLCEISTEGISTPGGLWGTLRFVSWRELVRFELIHDDDWGACDYFVLWDREGRPRIDARSWIENARPSDRARIFRALRSRFPGEGKAVRSAGPALVASASSALWDRELDG